MDKVKDFLALKLLINFFMNEMNEIKFDESDKLYENYKKREMVLSDFMNDYLLNKRNVL